MRFSSVCLKQISFNSINIRFPASTFPVAIYEANKSYAPLFGELLPGDRFYVKS